jgi:hypothetical protein
MSSKTVNEDLLIVTQGSKHLADTTTPKDRCFLIDKKTVVPYRNYIPTSACDDAEATQKTLIRGHRIVHSESRIGTDHGKIPSKDDNFQGFGGGVANGQVYFKHANDYPGSHSKNVKVEGKWIVRTNDETQQNKRNCTGRFREGDGGITEDELEALLNKNCTVESVSAHCDHKGRTTDTDRLGVLEGDKVTVTMVHVNDAEVDPAARKKPVCQVPRRKAQGKLPADAKVHPYFRVTRSAYPKTSWREALPALTKEISGLTIVLAEEWLGKGPKKEEEGKLQIAKDPKDKPDKFKKDSYDQFGTVKGAPPLEGARMLRDQKEDDTHIPAQQARGRQEANAALQRDMELRQMREAMAQDTRDKVAALRERDKRFDEGRERTQAVKKLGAIGLTTIRAVQEIFHAKPVEVKVEALACAGAKVMTIAAYPPQSYKADVVELVKSALKVVKDAIDAVRKFLNKVQGAHEKEEGADAPAVEVAITAGRFQFAVWFLADSAGELAMEYKELERDAAGPHEAVGRKKHEVFLAYSLDIKFERLIGIKCSQSVPLSMATGALGAFAQRLLDRVGADLNVKFEIELSSGVSSALEWDQYGKIEWTRKVQITPTAKFTMSLNATARSMSFSIGVTVEWKPTFELEKAENQPMVLKRNDSKVDIKWFVKAAVNIFGWTVDFEYGDTIWSGKIGPAKYTL